LQQTMRSLVQNLNVLEKVKPRWAAVLQGHFDESLMLHWHDETLHQA